MKEESMSSKIPTPIRRSGSLEHYAAGLPFRLGPMRGYDEVMKEMARVTRLVTAGKLEVEAGSRIVAMLGQIVKTINLRRRAELDERRLDLLGAAAEEGAAVFEGIAIIPPPSRYQRKPEPVAPKPPTIDIEPGEPIKIKPRLQRKP